MKKILVIDDEKNIRTNLSMYLESEGFQVVTAMNGEDGLKKYQDGDFDLVLLDMKLPGKNGLEVLREIKNETDQDATVIMITGYSTVENAVETMKLGAVDYLQKPFTPEEITQIVNEVLERRKLDQKAGDLTSIDEYLAYAKKAIQRRDFEKAKEFLSKASVLEEKKAEVFNLLGAINEMLNNQGEAMKFYRAALALDPSYKPAQANISRASKFGNTLKDIDIDDREEDR